MFISPRGGYVNTFSTLNMVAVLLFFEYFNGADGVVEVTKVSLRSSEVVGVFWKPRTKDDCLALETLGVMGLYLLREDGTSARKVRRSSGLGKPDELRMRMTGLAQALAGEDEGRQKVVVALGLDGHHTPEV